MKTQNRWLLDGDINFILATWLKSYNYSGDIPAKMKDSDYYTTYEPLIKEIINRSKVLVLCWEEDQDLIIGWVCFEYINSTTILHYMFVKEAYRRTGMLNKMLEDIQFTPDVVFTHYTPPMSQIKDKKEWKYNPYLIWSNNGNTSR